MIHNSAIKFTIPGSPQGKARPKFARHGNYVQTYTPKKTKDYENEVKLEYIRKYPNKCYNKSIMLVLHINAYYSIPKKTNKQKRAFMLAGKIRPIKKPDMDNIIKIIADALNKTAYYDDAQIVESTVCKFYSDNPRVEVILQDILPPDSECEE